MFQSLYVDSIQHGLPHLEVFMHKPEHIILLVILYASGTASLNF